MDIDKLTEELSVMWQDFIYKDYIFENLVLYRGCYGLQLLNWVYFAKKYSDNNNELLKQRVGILQSELFFPNFNETVTNIRCWIHGYLFNDKQCMNDENMVYKFGEKHGGKRNREHLEQNEPELIPTLTKIYNTCNQLMDVVATQMYPQLFVHPFNLSLWYV